MPSTIQANNFAAVAAPSNEVNNLTSGTEGASTLGDDNRPDGYGVAIHICTIA